MPSPNDASADKPDASLPAEGDISNAARLLEEIRERMERLEGNLSLRERRLARVERALRDADSKLQQDRSKFTSERDSIEKDLSKKLRDREQQLEQSTRALQENQQRLASQLARERETLARVEKLTRERDQAAQGLMTAREELAAQQKREKELEIRLTEMERRRQKWEPVSTAGEAPAAAAAVDHVATSAGSASLPLWVQQITARMEPLLAKWRELNAKQQAVAKKMVIALPALSLLIAIIVFAAYPDTFNVSANVVGESRDAAVLAGFAAGGGFPGVSAHVQESEGLLQFTQKSHDAAAAKTAVDAAAHEAVTRLSTPATRPAEFAEREKRRGELAGQLAALRSKPAATQPTTLPAFAKARPAGLTFEPAQLLSQLEATLTQRESLSNRLTEINRKLTGKAPETVAIPEDQLRAARQADQLLQADSEVLAGRESELSETLKQTIEAARVRFEDLPRKSGDADKAVAEILAAPQDQDVKDSLQTIRNTLAQWSENAKTMAATWQEQRAALDPKAGDPDPGARQAAMETAAKRFLESSGNGLTALNKALESISQGGEEPTKRLVLRRTLGEKLQPAIDSREALAGIATRSQATDNVELAGLLGRVVGLRAQVVERRNRLEAGLRQRLLDEARAQFEKEMAQLRQEREQLLTQTSGLDEALVQQAVKAFWLLGDTSQGPAALLAKLDFERQRAAILDELRALDDADARTAAALPPPVVLRRTPAVAVNITSTSRRLGSAVLGGLVPEIVLGLAIAAITLRRRWGASGTSIEEYAKALRDLPERRPGLEHQKQQG